MDPLNRNDPQLVDCDLLKSNSHNIYSEMMDGTNNGDAEIEIPFEVNRERGEDNALNYGTINSCDALSNDDDTGKAHFGSQEDADEGTFVIPSFLGEIVDARDLLFSSANIENREASSVADMNEETGIESFHTIEERKGEYMDLAFYDPAICDISEMPEPIEEKPVKEEIPYVREFVYEPQDLLDILEEVKKTTFTPYLGTTQLNPFRYYISILPSTTDEEEVIEWDMPSFQQEDLMDLTSNNMNMDDQKEVHELVRRFQEGEEVYIPEDIKVKNPSYYGDLNPVTEKDDLMETAVKTPFEISSVPDPLPPTDSQTLPMNDPVANLIADSTIDSNHAHVAEPIIPDIPDVPDPSVIDADDLESMLLAHASMHEPPSHYKHPSDFRNHRPMNPQSIHGIGVPPPYHPPAHMGSTMSERDDINSLLSHEAYLRSFGVVPSSVYENRSHPQPLDKPLIRLVPDNYSDEGKDMFIPGDLPGEMASKNPREITRGSVRGMGRSVPKGMTKGMPRGVPRGMPRDMNRNVPRGMPRGVPGDMPRDMPRGMPRGMPRSVPRDMPRDMSRDMPRDIPRDMPRDTPRDIPKSSSQEMPRGSPHELPRDGPRGLLNPMPSMRGPDDMQTQEEMRRMDPRRRDMMEVRSREDMRRMMILQQPVNQPYRREMKEMEQQGDGNIYHAMPVSMIPMRMPVPVSVIPRPLPANSVMGAMAIPQGMNQDNNMRMNQRLPQGVQQNIPIRVLPIQAPMPSSMQPSMQATMQPSMSSSFVTQSAAPIKETSSLRGSVNAKPFVPSHLRGKVEETSQSNSETN